jgi:hypothetical protein
MDKGQRWWRQSREAMAGRRAARQWSAKSLLPPCLENGWIASSERVLSCRAIALLPWSMFLDLAVDPPAPQRRRPRAPASLSRDPRQNWKRRVGQAGTTARLSSRYESTFEQRCAPQTQQNAGPCWAPWPAPAPGPPLIIFNQATECPVYTGLSFAGPLHERPAPAPEVSCRGGSPVPIFAHKRGRRRRGVEDKKKQISSWRSQSAVPNSSTKHLDES